MPVLPATITIQHQVFTTTGTDEHNNPIGTLADPVDRSVIGVYQFGADHDHGEVDPISVEYAARTIIDMVLQVPDPTLYKKWDNVLIFDGDNWIAFEVQGRPVDWRLGIPWPRYGGLFGGIVHARRVN